MYIAYKTCSSSFIVKKKPTQYLTDTNNCIQYLTSEIFNVYYRYICVHVIALVFQHLHLRSSSYGKDAIIFEVFPL